jgi:hypothetical protein
VENKSSADSMIRFSDLLSCLFNFKSNVRFNYGDVLSELSQARKARAHAAESEAEAFGDPKPQRGARVTAASSPRRSTPRAGVTRVISIWPQLPCVCPFAERSYRSR